MRNEFSVNLAASVFRLEMHAELLESGDVQNGHSQQGASQGRIERRSANVVRPR